ncbi:MAG: hypothetical protein U0031_23100 [Thermomicrobiales bacterium]
MKHDDLMHADEIDRHWDAFALSGRAPGTTGLDVEDAAVIAWLWAESAPADSVHVRERVWQELQGERQRQGTTARGLPASSPGAMGSTMGTTLAGGPHGVPAVPRRDAFRWQVMASHAMTAVLLVVTVALVVLVIGRQWWSGVISEPDHPVMVVAPAETMPETTVLQTTIPAEMLPRGDRVMAELGYITIPARSTGAWVESNGASRPGLRLLHVVAGTLDVRAERPATILRGNQDRSPTEAPAGTDVVLNQGDSWIVRNQTPWQIANPSSQAVEAVLWVIADLTDPGAVNMYFMPNNWSFVNYVISPPGIDVPAGTTTLRLRRVEFDADGRLDPPPGGLQYGVALPWNADGTPIIGPNVGLQPSGKLINLGQRPATVYVLTLQPVDTEASSTHRGAPP